MNVKVIDKSTKENDQSHQNVNNTKGQGAKISLFLNTTHELTETGLSEILNQNLYTMVFYLSKKLRHIR